MTPEERSTRARIAVLTRHAMSDPRPSALKASRAFMESFERKVDPDGVLPIPERAKRAERLRKVYFANLSKQGVAARRKAK